MQRRQSILTVFVLVGGGLATVLLAGGPAAAVATDCAFDVASETPRETWRRVSLTAELVAPSGLRAGHDATGSRRRAVKPPTAPIPVAAKNFIDTEIFGKMTRDGVRWTGLSTDEEFLRRVFLDLTGQIPTADRAKAFLADTRPDKRERLVDELLASDEFTDRWTLWFGDHVQNVRISANINLFPQGRNAWYLWIKESFRAAKPYDAMVRELLTARGGAFTAGAANYWVRQIQTNGPVQDTFDNLSSDSAEKFLGLPLNCLSCHNGLGHLEQVNSSLVKRTRQEFWQNAAFFATDVHRPQRDQVNNTTEFFIEANPVPARARYQLNTNSGNKTPRQPAEGQPNTVDPAFFLSGETPKAGELPREAYARILTAHPQFARASVNYIWKEMFGLGIVEPADSFDLLRQGDIPLAPGASLQPTHPELLTKLAAEFTATGFNFRALLKTIVTSSTYQLSSEYGPGAWSELWTPYYARHYPRRMLAESVVDAVGRATNVPPPRMTVQGLTIDRAMQLPDPTEPRNAITTFLNSFGRGDRDTTPRTREGSIVQALSMLNDSYVTTRTKNSGNSTVQRVLAASKDPGYIADELYLATLSRKPSPDERAAAIAHLSAGEIVRQTEDLQYVLLNRLDFLYY